MNIAVTGGSGHIGANLIRELIADGHRVKALVHTNQKAFESLDIKLVPGDLHNKPALIRLCDGAEVVFHLAARISIGQYSLQQLVKVNVEGTEKVIQACKEAKVKRIVHFSSIHALDQFPLNRPLTEKNATNLNSSIPYERTKAISEDLVRRSALKNGLEVVIINPTAVIGPHDFGPSYLGQFLIRIHQGRIPGLVPGGYDWVDARDVARGAIEAAKHGANGERYILSGRWAELPELTSLISTVTGKQISLPMLPYWLALMGIPFTGLWARIKQEAPLYTRESLKILRTSNSRVLHDKASKAFGYAPIPLEETIRDSYNWFENNAYL